MLSTEYLREIAANPYALDRAYSLLVGDIRNSIALFMGRIRPVQAGLYYDSRLYKVRKHW